MNEKHETQNFTFVQNFLKYTLEEYVGLDCIVLGLKMNPAGSVIEFLGSGIESKDFLKVSE